MGVAVLWHRGHILCNNVGVDASGSQPTKSTSSHQPRRAGVHWSSFGWQCIEKEGTSIENKFVVLCFNTIFSVIYSLLVELEFVCRLELMRHPVLEQMFQSLSALYSQLHHMVKCWRQFHFWRLSYCTMAVYGVCSFYWPPHPNSWRKCCCSI